MSHANAVQDLTIKTLDYFGLPCTQMKKQKNWLKTCFWSSLKRKLRLLLYTTNCPPRQKDWVRFNYSTLTEFKQLWWKQRIRQSRTCKPLHWRKSNGFFDWLERGLTRKQRRLNLLIKTTKYFWDYHVTTNKNKMNMVGLKTILKSLKWMKASFSCIRLLYAMKITS